MQKCVYKIISIIAVALTFGYGSAIAKEYIPYPYAVSYDYDNESLGRKPNKLDHLIKKVYLIATDVLATNSYEDDFNKLPKQGVYIKTNIKTEKESAVEDVVKKNKGVKNILNQPKINVGEGKRDGLLTGIFSNRKSDSPKAELPGSGISAPNIISETDSVNPLFWDKVREDYKKKRAERNNQLEQNNNQNSNEADNPNAATLVGDDKGFNLLLQRRPKDNYRTERLPSAISKKQYSRENEHLPQVVYESEYKKMLFDSVYYEDLNVMRALIDRMGTTEVRDPNGNTPLLYAIMADKPVATKVLLGMGAGIDVTNYNGTSPLYVAIKKQNDDLVNLLVKKGGNAEIVDNNGKNLLMLAAADNNLKMVTKLLNKGIDVNKAMSDGNTALHFAAKKGSSLVAKELLAQGAMIDKRNFYGYTPLMIAALHGMQDVAKLLIDQGADITVSDAMGQNALSIAEANAHHNVAAMLVSANSRVQNNLFNNQVAYSPLDESLARIPMPVRKPMVPPTPSFSDEEKAKMLKTGS